MTAYHEDSLLASLCGVFFIDPTRRSLCEVPDLYKNEMLPARVGQNGRPSETTGADWRSGSKRSWVTSGSAFCSKDRSRCGSYRRKRVVSCGGRIRAACFREVSWIRCGPATNRPAHPIEWFHISMKLTTQQALKEGRPSSRLHANERSKRQDSAWAFFESPPNSRRRFVKRFTMHDVQRMPPMWTSCVQRTKRTEGHGPSIALPNGRRRYAAHNRDSAELCH